MSLNDYKAGDLVLIPAVVTMTNGEHVMARVHEPAATLRPNEYMVHQQRVARRLPSGTLDLSTYTAEEGFYEHD